jgi:hypothetical protein
MAAQRRKVTWHTVNKDDSALPSSFKSECLRSLLGVRKNPDSRARAFSVGPTEPIYRPGRTHVCGSEYRGICQGPKLIPTPLGTSMRSR